MAHVTLCVTFTKILAQLIRLTVIIAVNGWANVHLN